MQITTIGLDIAKNVFQVHGIDAGEKVIVRMQLRRSQVLAFFKALPPCLVGMEACASSHCWARELTKLGHQVRLMPAKDVKAYVKRNKNDAADAEAICEAVRRPTMRFVQIKSVEQQGRHRGRYNYRSANECRLLGKSGIRDTWRHIAKCLDDAALGNDIPGAVVALRLVLQLERVPLLRQ